MEVEGARRILYNAISIYVIAKTFFRKIAATVGVASTKACNRVGENRREGVSMAPCCRTKLVDIHRSKEIQTKTWGFNILSL